jgi:hypothetical protein
MVNGFDYAAIVILLDDFWLKVIAFVNNNIVVYVLKKEVLL